MGEAIEEVEQCSGAAAESGDEHHYKLLVSGLEDVKTNLDECSKSLLICHSSAASFNEDFLFLREDLTDKAIVYVDLNFPFAVQVVTDLQDFFMQYSALDFKEFKRNIKAIDKSISKQAEGAVVLTKVNNLLLSDLIALQTDADKRLKSLKKHAEEQRNSAAEALEASKREKEKYDAEEEECKDEQRKCAAEKKDYGVEKTKYDKMMKFQEEKTRKFDSEKQEHEKEKQHWDDEKEKHQLDEMKWGAEKRKHEEDRLKCDEEKLKHDTEKTNYEEEERTHAAVQMACDADKKEYAARADYLKKEKDKAGTNATAGVVVGGIVGVTAVVFAAPGAALAAVVVGGVAAHEGYSRKTYADREQIATSNGQRAADEGEEAKKQGRIAAEKGKRAAEEAERAAERGQRAADNCRKSALEKEIAAKNGRKAAEKEEIAEAKREAAAKSAAEAAESARRAEEYQEKANGMERAAAEKVKIAAGKAEKATKRGKDVIAEGKRKAKIATQQADECSKAVKLIKEDMIKSLNRFIDAMSKITGFMASLAKDTKYFAEKVKDVRLSSNMKMHLECIKKYESMIVTSCRAFVMFHTTVQARCNSLRHTLDRDLDATDEPGVTGANGWCTKHKASGKLQPRELAILQFFLGIEVVGNLVIHKRANSLQKFMETMGLKKSISYR